MMRFSWASFIVILVSLVASCFAFLLLFAFGFLLWIAPGPLTQQKIFYVPPNTSIINIATNLQEALPSKTLFVLLARTLVKTGHTLHAGEYRLPTHASLREIFSILQKGLSLERKLTIPEGLTSWEIARFIKYNRFLEGNIAHTPPEGSMLPETYYFTRGTSREKMIKRMQKALRHTLAKAWANRDPHLPLKSPTQAIILASIVEKEARLSSERSLIASVFYNRLKRHIPLQADPTTLYARDHGEVSPQPLTSKELLSTDPYNTYTHKGLPPTPICNPGFSSIYAVLHPAQTAYLYFVRSPENHHAFSRTLREHNKNVRLWYAYLKKEKNKEKNKTKGDSAPPKNVISKKKKR